MSHYRTTLTFAACLALACFTVRVLATEEQSKDNDLLKGTWKVKEVDVAGKHDGAREGSTDQKWDITNGKIVIRFGDGAEEEWTYTIASTSSPQSIDLKKTAGVKAGATPLGIYELKGDTLRICFNGDGKRPPRFDEADLGDSRFGRRIVLERR
jgi:uncharacterized protein (TIGR03067 family)